MGVMAFVAMNTPQTVVVVGLRVVTRSSTHMQTKIQNSLGDIADAEDITWLAAHDRRFWNASIGACIQHDDISRQARVNGRGSCLLSGRISRCHHRVGLTSDPEDLRPLTRVMPRKELVSASMIYSLQMTRGSGAR
jgi:hypothetical protein